MKLIFSCPVCLREHLLSSWEVANDVQGSVIDQDLKKLSVWPWSLVALSLEGSSSTPGVPLTIFTQINKKARHNK